ncbi:MAG: SUKH-4 family immunity protein, partial [Thermoguttaceae bacterium]
HAGDWLVVGDDYGTELRVDGAGSVYSVDPRGKLPTRFVNSSLSALAEFIDAHRALLSDTRDAEPDEAAQVAAVESFHRRLALVDAVAFSDNENWWAVIVEQMRDGLL